jgi:hypothetical protein
VSDEFDQFVSHPRYGRRPRTTGLNPGTTATGDVVLHWHTPDQCRIPNTALAADLSRQSRATVPVTHYFDAKRQCRDCGRWFIFFAEEQKHWYEELGFALEADCIRCVDCRRKQRGLERARQRYEDLFHVVDRTPDQDLEMAECCVALVETGVFHTRQLERVRMSLNRIPMDLPEDMHTRSRNIRARLLALERAGASSRSDN